MRIGLNEVKGVQLDGYLRHRVVLPVYIPKLEGYYEHALEILKLCLESLRLTVAGRANVTIVCNGSIEVVVEELRRQYAAGWIDQLVLNQTNRGRVDGVVPTARGAYEELITITDCDVLFTPGWLEAVEDIFRQFPECGFASPSPNPIFTWYYNTATTLGGFASRELAFEKVVPDADLDRFAHSIGRPDLYRPEHRRSQMILKRGGATACVGCGHFVFTIRREVMAAYPKDPCLKAMGGGSPQIHDLPPDKLGYWRLSTTRAYAYHMGNTPEPWMYDQLAEYRAAAGTGQPAEARREALPARLPRTSRL
ncbi:MAG: glycosyltransferase family A protein, partial [Pyrinomonadaceae bacterium]